MALAAWAGAASAVVLPSVPGWSGSAPAGAATASLSPVRTVDVQFGNRYTAPGTTERYSSPAVGDLNGDDQPELVVAAPNGTITATRLDNGARLWQRALGATEIHATPVIDDVDGNGSQDVVAATMDGRVVWLNGQTGAVMRTFRQGAPLHCPAGVDCRPDGFFGTPAIGDVNGDGIKDIVASSYDHTVYAWSRNGTLLWRAFLYDTIWSSPVIADLDRNGRNEVVVGGDIYAGNPLGVAAGGLMWALNGSNGTRWNGYPKSLPGQTTWSSPVVSDINGDGRLDIVVGTGTNGPFGDGAAQRRVWAFTATNRQNLPGWPVTAAGRVAHQPAVGDVDADGQREVLVNTETGYLEVFEANGTRRWATCNANSRTSGCGGLVSHAGAVIADIDDDGVQEVIATSGVWLRVYDARTGTLEAEHQFPGGYGNIHPATVPAVSELNGKAIVAATTFYRAGGHSGPERNGDYVRTTIVRTDEHLCGQDWPSFKGGARGSSVLPDRFAWNPFPCARPFVAQQYRDILGRNLDAAGQDYWAARMRSGTWSGPRVVQGFMASPEFGGVVAPIVRVHLALKDAAPGPSSQIRQQVADLRTSTATLGEISQSIIDAGTTAPSDDGLVTAVYQRLRGRVATAAERSAALNEIASSGQGTWVATMATQYDDIVVRLRGRVQVATSYIGLLDRAPDAGGWTYWVGQVDAGVSAQRLIEQFLNTSEYRNRVLD